MNKKQKFIKAAELALLWNRYVESNGNGHSLKEYEKMYKRFPSIRDTYLDCFNAFRIGAEWSIPELPSLLMSEAYAE